MNQPQQRSTRLLAVVALFALLATACGAVVTASEQRRATASGAASAPAAPAPAAPAQPSQPTAAEAVASEALGATTDQAPEPGGHQFGTTLDDWVEEDAETGLGDPSPGYSDIEWTDLIPAGASAEELLARFDEELNTVQPGTDEADELYAEIRAQYDPEAVNDGLNGEKIRLAGFIAPLTYDDDIITEFFLVPTFGACIHVPPPPPNQTIMVSVDRENGLTFDDSWGAVWVEGTMVIESTESTDLGATSSYRITEATSGAYTRF